VCYQSGTHVGGEYSQLYVVVECQNLISDCALEYSISYNCNGEAIGTGPPAGTCNCWNCEDLILDAQTRKTYFLNEPCTTYGATASVRVKAKDQGASPFQVYTLSPEDYEKYEQAESFSVSFSLFTTFVFIIKIKKKNPKTHQPFANLPSLQLIVLCRGNLRKFCLMLRERRRCWREAFPNLRGN